MKNKIKKYHIVLMSFMALFIAVFASMFSLRADTVDEETGEVLTDNWELGMVFYDSTVNGGTTQLSAINWNAITTESRTITIQVNYKNNSAVTTYNPGELTIEMPNLHKLIKRPNIRKYHASTITPTTSTGTAEQGYHWNCIYSGDTIILTNNMTIPALSNFEGSVQIQYVIGPQSVLNGVNTEFYSTLKYKSNKIVDSNNLSISFTSNKKDYTITKTPSALKGYDGLPENASEYIWVKWTIRQDHDSTKVRYVHSDTIYLEEIVPINAIVLDKNLNQIENTNGTIIFEADQLYVTGQLEATIVIGYPRSEYENKTITNTINSYGIYLDEEEESLLATNSKTINTKDYEFNYTGSLYLIDKQGTHTDIPVYYCQRNLPVITSFAFGGVARYTGSPMDIVFGDDILFAPNSQGEYNQLTDNEYSFKEITYYGGSAKNINNALLKDIEMYLYIRYANTTEYVQYGDVMKGNKEYSKYYNQGSGDENCVGPKIVLPDNVVGFKIVLKNVSESFVGPHNTSGHYLIEPKIELKKQDIADTGKLYNFAYMQVYINGELQNEPTLNSYATQATQFDIATYDQETYGTYMQRDVASNDLISNKIEFNFAKYMNSFKDYPVDEMFKMEYKIYNSVDLLYGNMSNFKGIIYYDLLPEGVSLESTKSEIINSISPYGTIASLIPKIKTKSGKTFINTNDYIDYYKEHCNITIKENWNNTNRTWVKVEFNFEDDPIDFNEIIEIADTASNTIIYYYIIPTISIKTYLTYDNYVEYGKDYKNVTYMEIIDLENMDYKILSTGSLDQFWIKDSGNVDPIYDIEAADINENGITTEYLYGNSYKKTITTLVATHQDVTTFVQTDKNNYTTNISDSSCNSEYTYKLRVRTGHADVTNMIIYTNIEEAQPSRTRWKGEFLGVDTTYAESKGYTVKTYYSENSAADNLYNEDGTLNSNWKEYIPDTPAVIANGLAITFDENFKTYNSSDYLCIYYYYNGQLYRTPSYYNTTLAGKTIEIPSTDIYFYWYTNSSGNSAYGFKINNIEPKVVTATLGSTASSLPSINPIELTNKNYPETNHNPYNNNEQILWHYTYLDNLILEERIEHIDKTKVKSLAFEYLDSEGNPAIIPSNNLTYVLINMKSPANENIKTLARMDCWTEWNAIDEFGVPVYNITGINSNVVKVALPNSVKEDSMPSVTLKFIKEIQGTDSEFKNMKLDKTGQQTFMIRLTSLTANDDGSYNQLTALLKSNQELIISQIPVGTYLLEELNDNYFDFVEFTENNNSEIIIEGVTFEQTDAGYVITVSESLTEDIEFNIKVTNEIEPFRPYEDKENKENLFLKNKIEENA